MRRLLVLGRTWAREPSGGRIKSSRWVTFGEQAQAAPRERGRRIERSPGAAMRRGSRVCGATLRSCGVTVLMLGDG